MEFGLDKSQKEIQKAAIEFGKGEMDKELCLELEKKKEFPKEIFAKAGDLGFIGMHFPEKYSGQDLGLLDDVLVIETLCRKDSTIGGALALSKYGAECVAKYAADDLKEKYLPQVMEGKMLSSAAIFEPGHNTDMAVLDTRAVKEGDGWVINGEKAYVINGADAGFYVVLCQTDDSAKAGKGLSMFLVDAGTAGITADPVAYKLGLRNTSTAHVKLENVKVPAANLIGKEGDGYKQAQEFLDVSRIIMAAMATGTAQGALDRTLEYSKEREQFGRKIAQFEISQHIIAEVATAVEQARMLTYLAAWSYDNGQGKAESKLASMAKITATNAAVNAGNYAIQLFGGYGYMVEYEVESFNRDAKLLQVIEGSEGSQKSAIAAEIVGKVK